MSTVVDKIREAGRQVDVGALQRILLDSGDDGLVKVVRKRSKFFLTIERKGDTIREPERKEGAV